MLTQPTNAYGRSKLAAEGEFAAWHAEQADTAVLIIRPAVVYGEYNTANVFRLIKHIHKGLYFDVGAGANIKSIAYVKNLVAATFFLIEKQKSGVDVYNYADEPQLEVKTLSNIIASHLKKRPPYSMPLFVLIAAAMPFEVFKRITGVDVPISVDRVIKLGRATHHRADKVRKIGFEAKYSNAEGVSRMIDWMHGARELK